MIVDSRLGYVDDWLRRERFVFVGWSGLLLLPCAYLAVGSFLTGLRMCRAPILMG